MELVSLARDAASGLAYRRGVMVRLAKVVPYDVGLFHALSPRVPLDTGVFVGLTPDGLGVEGWDALAVALGRFRDVALARGGVAADTEVVPASGPLRRRYREAVERRLGLMHLVLCHLVVRGELRAVVGLGRRRARPFTADELALLRAWTPLMAVGDALHQELDRLPQARRGGDVCADGRLTPRQREIVTLVARGHTNAQIGEALGLSANTVRNRLADAFRRLDVGSRAELVTRASFAQERVGRESP